MDKANQLGKNFSLQQYLGWQKTTKEIVRAVAEKITPGMDEQQAQDLLDSAFKSNSVRKYWHPIKVRFGKNTLKSFKEASAPGVILSDSDLFFFDVGPIFEGHESDFGETFVLGHRGEHVDIQKAVKEIFNRVAKYWKSKKVCGAQLYDFAQACAQKLGYHLNPKMGGHRLGDFPHSIHYRGSLADYGGEILPNLWVLEILICDPKETMGAFHEDILIGE